MPRHASGAKCPEALQTARVPKQTVDPAQPAASCGTPCERIVFDRFTLLTRRRLLLRDGVPVPIGARAFDILVSLVARNGALATTGELLAEVWPTTCVEPSNVRVQMVALRKTLGDGDGRLIATDPGRGYRLAAPLVPVPELSASAEPRRAASPSPPLAAISRIVGRDESIDNHAVPFLREAAAQAMCEARRRMPEVQLSAWAADRLADRRPTHSKIRTGMNSDP